MKLRPLNSFDKYVASCHWSEALSVLSSSSSSSSFTLRSCTNAIRRTPWQLGLAAVEALSRGHPQHRTDILLCAVRHLPKQTPQVHILKLVASPALQSPEALQLVAYMMLRRSASLWSVASKVMLSQIKRTVTSSHTLKFILMLAEQGHYRMAQTVISALPQHHECGINPLLVATVLARSRLWGKALGAFATARSHSSDIAHHQRCLLMATSCKLVSWSVAIGTLSQMLSTAHTHSICRRRLLSSLVVSFDDAVPDGKRSFVAALRELGPIASVIDRHFVSLYKFDSNKYIRSHLRRKFVEVFDTNTCCSAAVSSKQQVLVVDTSVVLCQRRRSRTHTVTLKCVVSYVINSRGIVVVPFSVVREVCALLSPVISQKRRSRSTLRKPLRDRLRTLWKQFISHPNVFIVSCTQEVPSRVLLRHRQDADSRILAFVEYLTKIGLETVLATNDSAMGLRARRRKVTLFEDRAQ
eukprot:PhM_4_TR19086/c0_g1_i2/m.96413